jgi:hypothetical protein
MDTSDPNIAEVEPAEKFQHVLAVRQITGAPSALSMRYVLPQKD